MKFKIPAFFPDATRAVLKTLDSRDIENTHTDGVLVNTYHLYATLGIDTFKKYNGVRNFMGWNGVVISDSGGFQVMSIAKKGNGKITDQGVVFRPSRNRKDIFTPEKSISFQFALDTDLMVVLDDFTPPGASRKIARDTVERTISWAKRSKSQFEKECEIKGIEDKDRPLLIGVVQGGDWDELRAECSERLVDIGFDGLGYGGWPLNKDGEFQYGTAELIAKSVPPEYVLYGLGIGKPHEVVSLSKMGYGVFDCVLPTRDARHKRLYVYNATSVSDIDIHKPDFYSYYTPDKQKHQGDNSAVSTACDCLLCTRYTRGYLAHLFHIQDTVAMRLATIHNLRFYSILMEKIRDDVKLSLPR